MGSLYRGLYMIILMFLYLNAFSITFVGLKCEFSFNKFLTENICLKLMNRYGNSKGSIYE